jgi:hypothetical protein
MTAERDPAASQERLDELDDKIASARRKAEDANDLGPDGMFTDTEPAFHESGTIRPEDDDQTIAPPG